MMTKALGLIEVIGYPTVIEAADAALKAANVQLGGIVKVDGGIMTAQILGDVGAVKAAVDAGGMAAAKVGPVRATHVIPRVDESLFGTVIKLRGVEEASTQVAPPIETIKNEEEVADTDIESEDALQAIDEIDPVNVIEDEVINPIDIVVPESRPIIGMPTEDTLENMSNKELKTLIASLGIKVAEKKLKSAKKQDLIGLLKDFYKE